MVVAIKGSGDLVAVGIGVAFIAQPAVGQRQGQGGERKGTAETTWASNVLRYVGAMGRGLAVVSLEACLDRLLLFSKNKNSRSTHGQAMAVGELDIPRKVRGAEN